MKRFLLTTAVVGLTVLIAPAAPAAGGDVVVTERYYALETWSAIADNGQPNPGTTGPGDVYVSRQRLTTLDGRPVGTAYGYLVGLRMPYVFSHWTALLPHGTLTLEGAMQAGTKVAQRFVIVGGTGRYEGARGNVTVSDAGTNGALAVLRFRG